MTTTILLPEIHEQLFAWWLENGRVLPWRTKLTADSSSPIAVGPSTGFSAGLSDLDVFHVREKAFTEYMTHELRRDPYRVVVAELMLQQTQVDRVLPKYLDWMARWPRIEDLSKAQLAEVLIFWKGLGYNRRARYLWLLAKKISEDLEGIWPQTEVELLELPGLGKYTARAMMSFAFGQQVAVVDTNVRRVLRRVLEGLEAAALPTLSGEEWFDRAESVLPLGQADPWNQLIMDLGAMVCTAKAPKCEACPVSNLCQAQQLALSKGFETYRDYLKIHPPEKKASKKAVRFEDTDRFFRGRIIDLLRERPFSQPELWQTLNQDYGLPDVLRCDKLVSGLMKEGMIRSSDSLLSLG